MGITLVGSMGFPTFLVTNLSVVFAYIDKMPQFQNFRLVPSKLSNSRLLLGMLCCVDEAEGAGSREVVHVIRQPFLSTSFKSMSLIYCKCTLNMPLKLQYA